MKKNVVVVSASPRRGGNTDLLCDAFVKGAASAGHEVEKISLRDKTIRYCTGCGACYLGKQCPQHDDMPGILDRIVAADVIVLATPIYFYTVCAQLKTMIDRCCSRYTEIADKDFYFIFAAGDPMPDAADRAITELRGFLYCLDNPRECGTVSAVGVMNKGDVLKKEYMDDAYQMGADV